MLKLPRFLLPTCTTMASYSRTCCSARHRVVHPVHNKWNLPEVDGHGIRPIRHAGLVAGLSVHDAEGKVLAGNRLTPTTHALRDLQLHDPRRAARPAGIDSRQPAELPSPDFGHHLGKQPGLRLGVGAGGTAASGPVAVAAGNGERRARTWGNLGSGSYPRSVASDRAPGRAGVRTCRASLELRWSRLCLCHDKHGAKDALNVQPTA